MHWSNADVTISFPGGPDEELKVWQWLNEIVQAAQQAEPPPPNRDLIVYLAFKCCADDHNASPPTADHKEFLRRAVRAGRMEQWSIVAYELDHDV